LRRKLEVQDVESTFMIHRGAGGFSSSSLVVPIVVTAPTGAGWRWSALKPRKPT